MEQQCPTVQIYPFAVVLLAAYLSGSHTDERAARIVVFTATVGQFHWQVLVHEHTVHAVAVQAMANGRDLRKINDAD